MSDDMVAAVEARVRRIRAGASASESLEPEAAADIRKVRGARDWERDLRARFWVGWLHWYRCEALPEGADVEDGEAAIEALTPCFVADMAPLPDGLRAALAGEAFPVAAALLQGALASPGRDQVATVVRLYQRILDATPESDVSNHAMVATMLCSARQALFERTGDPAELDAAVAAGRRGADTIPAGHRAQIGTLVNLAVALKTRADRAGAAAGRGDIDETIGVLRRASTLPGGAADPAVLANLCAALRARYDRYGDAADLEAAIEAGRRGRALAVSGNAGGLQIDANLAIALSARFALTSDPADLTESIGLLQAALDGMPATSADRPQLAVNLAAALWLRFGLTDSEGDLDRVIGLLRPALAGRPANVALRAMLVDNLSVALWARFKRSGAADDLDGAIDVGRQAVAALPAGDVNMARFQSNLSLALRERYERDGKPEDIAAAVAAARAAVAGTGQGHLDEARRLTNLGNALRQSFDHTGLADDMAGAIEALSAAADLFPADHPDRVKALSGLGNTLRAAPWQDGAGNGRLDYAVKVLRDAVRAVPVDSPERAGHLFNLGKALQTRCERTSAALDRSEAVDLLSEVAADRTAVPYLRVQAARSAAALAAESRPGEAAELAALAVELLPGTAPRHIGRRDQERYLGDFAGLASDAAALALLDPGAPAAAARALGLLEAGRGVLLSQALDTRDDLTDLAAKDGGLAARYVRLRDRLDRDPDGEPAQIADASGGALQLERRAGDRHRLAADFQATVDQIREQPGFERFMLPPGLPDLLREAGPRTVAAINVSRYRSDALLLAGGAVSSLPLPDLGPAAVDAHIDLLEQAVGRDRGGRGPQERANALNEVLEWLWDAVAGPVLDHLGPAGVPAPGAAPPRVWWMPGGPLGVLPLHAAGYHRERDGRTVLDRVIPSYTPTVRALGWALKRAPSAAPERSLIVAMPTTPGPNVPPLRYVTREAHDLAAILPRPTLLIEDPDAVSERTPTASAVEKALGEADIAHFACHAIADPADPSRGRLFLHDHEANPLTIRRLAGLTLSRAQLAYLSACETSRSASARLSDESVHLTSAFQLVGYPHVIGTLWPIQDRFAADTATAFYGRLGAAPAPLAVGTAASALRDVILERRDEGAPPLLWAAYLHAGA